MPLATLDDVKSTLGLDDDSEDALLTQLQGTAEAYIETYCGRAFGGGNYTEFHPGGARLLFLQNYPVLTIASLRVDVNREFPDESIVPGSRFVLHASRGVIESVDGPLVPSLPGWNVAADAFPGAVRVAYTTASATVPALVQRATAELVGHWYRQAKTHAATNQMNVIEVPGTTGRTVYPWAHALGYKIPVGVKELLGAYRVPSL